MTNEDNRYGDAPLGRSVEEVEGEAGNRVNPSAPGEQVRDDEMLAGVPVPPVLSGPAGTAMIPGITDGNRVTDGDSGGADDGTARQNRDSSEGTV
ncbi:hypothetical protein DAETH_12010 [Deinococcus aetherius]|uniref:Uncharacterized protein n=1 Tax=Deinococcus aetherius TaxID=200252 RepID=A0ABN6RCZ8_9DEIO|nr:hypothetical protein [Deinococcus aetherius]BDP41232.1 hypothetical protein DAETH_12010 [Deinococcus aetherius]